MTANFKIVRSDTFVFKFVVYLNGVAVNITGNTFTMTCRWAREEAVIFTRATGGSGIVLSDPTVGEATVTIVPANTNTLPIAVLNLPYDIQMTTAGGVVATVLRGVLKIYPDITR